MTTESLEFFMAISRGATLFDVAEKHHLSQSALSKQIKKLEEELGVVLFDRSGRSVKLTVEGEQLYKDLLLIEPSYKMLKHHIRLLASRNKIVCMVAFPIGCFGIRNILEMFTIQYPEILLSIVEQHQHRRQNLFKGLQKQELTFVIMHEPLLPNNLYRYKFLQKDYLVAILPITHQLADKSGICYADIQNETLLLNFWTKEVAIEVEEYTGIKPNNIVETNMGREDIVWHVATGHGIAIFYWSDIYTITMHKVKAVRFEDIPEQPIVMTYRSDLQLNSEHNLLCEYLEKEMKKNNR